jgi:hypothetical protein
MKTCCLVLLFSFRKERAVTKFVFHRLLASFRRKIYSNESDILLSGDADTNQQIANRKHTILVRNILFVAMGLLLPTLLILSAMQPLLAASSSKKKAEVHVDGVTLTINSDALPNNPFQSTPGSNFVQRAIATDSNPHKSFSVTAVPYGTRDDDLLPLAKEGGAEEYRLKLRGAWKNQETPPQAAPSIQIFGKQISGNEYHVRMAVDSLTEKSVLVDEWVAEAGKRLWIIRVLHENSSDATFKQKLADIKISSSTLDQPSTELKATQSIYTDTLQMPSVQAAQLSTTQSQALTLTDSNPTSALSTRLLAGSTGNLGFPSLWNGTVCDKANHPTAYALGASYRNVPACGPRPAYDADGYADLAVQYFSGAWGVLEFECVELSMRFMHLAYGINPYGANGNQVVANYSGSALKAYSSSGNGINASIAPGDILSWNTSSSAGHTSVVSGLSLNSAGSGSLTVMEQNGAASGSFTYPVSNWVVNTSGYGSILGWLHNPDASAVTTSSAAQPLATATNLSGGQEAFRLGNDGQIWHNWQDKNFAGGWAGWSHVAESSTAMSSAPTVTRNTDGRLEVFAVDKAGYVQHTYQLTPGGAWSTWSKLGTNATFASATPTIGLNKSGALEVFARGSDGAIWHIWQDKNFAGGWVSGWSYVTTPSTSMKSAPTVASTPDNRLELFTVDSSGYVEHAYQLTPGGAWSIWHRLSSNATFTSETPVVGHNKSGSFEIFARGTDNEIWHIWQDASYAGGWVSGWSHVAASSVKFNSAPGVVKNADGRLEIFGIDSAGHAQHAYQLKPEGAWSPWFQLATNVTLASAQPVAYVKSNGELEVFVVGSDGTPRHAWNTSSGWSNWEKF